MPDRATVYIALGANLENPADQVERAIGELASLPDARISRRSALYRSHAVGFTAQPDYINAVVELETARAPRDLLADLLDIERRHGRQRTFRDAPRTLDLDILLYGSLILDEPGLRLPHPRMHQRAFVLVPLAELAPDLSIPGRGPIKDLLNDTDLAQVSRLPDLDLPT